MDACVPFTLCFTLECCDSQSSANLLQHHITVSFYRLVGDKEMAQQSTVVIVLFSKMMVILNLVDFLKRGTVLFCVLIVCKLTVNTLGLTVQLATGVGSNT